MIKMGGKNIKVQLIVSLGEKTFSQLILSKKQMLNICWVARTKIILKDVKFNRRINQNYFLCAIHVE